jgi:hypothetical protein
LRGDNQFRPKLETLEAREVPATLLVNPANPTVFHTIQSAINAARPGDTISVAHASYQEDVVIDRGVLLIGAPDPVTHQNPFIVGSGGAGGIEAVVTVAPNVSNVRIQNFAIGDSEGQQPMQVGVLISSGAGNVTLGHDVIRKVRNPLVSVSGPAATVGILVAPGAHDVVIGNSALYQILDPPGSQGAVGILVSGANRVSIVHTYVQHVSDVGILVNGAATGVTLMADAVAQTLSSAGVGIMIEGTAQVTLHHDTVYQLPGTSKGLVVGGGAQVTGSKDEFAENAYGVVVQAGFTGSLALANSNIYANTLAGIINLSGVVVNATGDWWGDVSGPAPQGIGNAVLGLVNFSNWLSNEVPYL